MIKRLLLNIITLLFATYSLYSQYSTESRRAIAKFESARMNYQILNFEAAETDLLAALDADAGFIEAYLLLGQLYTDTRQVEKSVHAYENALAIDPVSYPRVMFFLGENQLALGRYQDAKKNFEKFLSTGYMSEELKEQTRKYLKNCKFAIYAMMNPVPFEPVNLGPNINSANDEYWPSQRVPRSRTDCRGKAEAG